MILFYLPILKQGWPVHLEKVVRKLKFYACIEWYFVLNGWVKLQKWCNSQMFTPTLLKIYTIVLFSEPDIGPSMEKSGREGRKPDSMWRLWAWNKTPGSSALEVVFGETSKKVSVRCLVRIPIVWCMSFVAPSAASVGSVDCVQKPRWLIIMDEGRYKKIRQKSGTLLGHLFIWFCRRRWIAYNPLWNGSTMTN